MLKKALTVVGLLATVFLVYLISQAVASWSADPSVGHHAAPPAPSVLTIAFGSCNREDRPQAYWETIAAHHPDAWLWLGDNVYADTGNREAMAADYATQRNAPAYAAFVENTPLIYGTWDDHDYGSNDAGREWSGKDMAEELLLDFLDVPADAEVRQRPGVYQSYRIGKVKVILLDTRYFRDALYPPVRSGDRYGQNPTGDVLGEAQWAWLREELTNSDAAAHVIASSIQVLPTDHGFEKWDLFPAARARLLSLLEEVRPALPLLLSGDRHLAEIMVDTVNGFPIHEITSSGLTHVYAAANEANNKRISPLIAVRNFGLLHFVDTPGGLQLLAEIRAIEDNAVLATLTLPAGNTNKAELMPLVYPKEPMARQLPPCPETPNCVSTQTLQPRKQREPIPFTGSVDAAREKLKRVIDNMPRTTLIEEDGNYLHYTFQTWPIPYLDDVEFLISPEEGVIHYRSASRVGHSDLGVNSRRMKKVVKAYRSVEP
ncbi:uncharacterized protein (DUF1499 family) [Lewinella marina]|uniref:PhoD-like phosphatase metallophosphatase domain-containing protein n=1 Tax=Neolewinella marina TaxID=438751 RepID=A0A2G0CBH2_9BACT|nr:DUF1499 domain-containing protein [Neolewinella marina]NJB87170.1 uncharacterized protein (DUF1499 family) [Neolewinella marina]PHK97305.1 hypothetical protein CGL56_15980 [Neolewinella marina]